MPRSVSVNGSGNLGWLRDWRRKLLEARLEVENAVGVFFDGTPTGIGKSHADNRFLKQHSDKGMRALMLLPTHEQCRSAASDWTGAGLTSVGIFPELRKDTCFKHSEASRIVRSGLPFRRILCPECSHSNECSYNADFKRAVEADTSVATHKRGEVMNLEITEDRHYISIHEAAIDTLRPTAQCDDPDAF